MKGKPYQILNASEGDHIILIDGSIGDWGENSSRNLSSLINNPPKNTKRIVLQINSPGGDVAEGIATFHAIQNSTIPVHGEIIGMCASIAGVIFQACAVRTARKMTRYMTHKMSGMVYGDSDKLVESAELMEKWEADIIEMFMEKTGKAKEHVQEWFQSGKDKWFSPKEMLEEGLLDEILETKATDKEPKNSIKTTQGIYAFYHAKINNHIIENTMKKEQLEKIGLKEGASESEINARLEALTKAENSAKEVLENSAKTLVKNAIEKGLIKKEQEEYALKQAKADLTGFGEFLETLSPAVRPTNMINRSNATGLETENRKKWDFNMWLEKDPDGLVAMEDENPEEYKRIVATQE